MNCWNCGTRNEPNARFCIQCGAPQALTCTVCGHGNQPGARFCLEKAWRQASWDAWAAERVDILESENPTPYYESGYRGQLAIRAAIRGDLATAEKELARASAIVAHLQNSASIAAYPSLIRAWVRLAEGRLAEAADEAEAAAANTNSLRSLVEGEDLLFGHLAGLLWSELAPGSTAAREAGDVAAVFFAERDAAAFVERFRGAVVNSRPMTVVEEVSVDG